MSYAIDRSLPLMKAFGDNLKILNQELDYELIELSYVSVDERAIFIAETITRIVNERDT